MDSAFQSEGKRRVTVYGKSTALPVNRGSGGYRHESRKLPFCRIIGGLRMLRASTFVYLQRGVIMLQKNHPAEHLNQAELVHGLADDLGISQVQSQRLLRATLGEIRALLTDGKAVSIPHWGTFDTTIHESRRSFLPFGFLSFGKGFAMLPKRRVPVFRTGKELRDEVYVLEGDVT